MAKQRNPALHVTRTENFADWYQAVILAADMAENSGVRGCMIIKPWGFKIWERVQRFLDREIRATGHENCYFPIFIPLDLIQKEAAHVEGFAKEMAVVTHHRLESHDGKLVPTAPLEVPLVVRPTSETMVGEAFARWIQSYRDLPVKINQWANVVRWELRPRLFLRTTEFLWQEGHTAHASAEEAIDETRTMLGVYRRVVEDCMAIPVIPGLKSVSERFPGADETHTIEAMMQDGRALQAGTSHYLGQNFSKAASIAFQDRDGEKRLVHTTSWGASTRLIGALIMVHADDDGLRLPPTIAPYQVVILPIIRDEANRDTVVEACRTVADRVGKQLYAGESVRCFVDLREDAAANKRWNWIKKGVPFICEIGPRDIESGQVSVHKRLDIEAKSTAYAIDAFVAGVSEGLEAVQLRLINEAIGFRKLMTRSNIDDFEALKGFFEKERGFVRAKWCGDPASETALSELGVTIRCLPYNQTGSQGRCVVTGLPATTDAIFAKAY
jgi:prolyl-tRNA synthetase